MRRHGGGKRFEKRPVESAAPDDLIFGRWPVRESLEAGRVAKVFLSNASRGAAVDDIVRLAKEKKVPFLWVPPRRLDEWAPGRHQGVVAQARPVPYADFDAVLDKGLERKDGGPGVLFLDGVSDPQNLGAILRSAVFFGVPGVVLPKWRSAGLTSAVLRTSAGAAGLVPVAQASNLPTALETAKKRGYWVVGADMSGKDVKIVEIPRPFALVLGSEGEGLHRLSREKCDLTVSIARKFSGSGIASLNVSAACAALLHAVS